MKAASPLLAALIGLVLWALPGTALAQNPLEIPQAPTPTVATPTTTTSTADSSSANRGLSKTDEALIFAIGVVLIGSIVYIIRRDARIHAPRATSTERGTPRSTVKPIGKRVERNRAQAKAARRQRKRKRGR